MRRRNSAAYQALSHGLNVKCLHLSMKHVATAFFRPAHSSWNFWLTLRCTRAHFCLIISWHSYFFSPHIGDDVNKDVHF